MSAIVIVLLLVYPPRHFGEDTKGRPVPLRVGLHDGQIDEAIDMLLRRLAVLDLLLVHLGCAIHARDDQEGAHPLAFADGGAFFGEVAGQGVDASAGEVVTASGTSC